MDVLRKARMLADYVASRWSLILGDEHSGPLCDNIGAVLVDAVFQAGLNYRNVVLPRVRAVARLYPHLDSLRDFEIHLQSRELALALNWSHHEKPRRLRELVGFLRSSGIETISDMERWIRVPANRPSLLAIKGVGPKTVDYLARLLGMETVAVDRHAFRLLRNIGIASRSYDDAKRVIEFAADLLKVSRWTFDRILWRALSGEARRLSTG